MTTTGLPLSFDGLNIFLIGIKGTGMTALAEVLLYLGATISGSDVEEEFYTDSLLKRMNVDVRKFSRQNITDDIQIVVHSAAYSKDENPELKEAEKRGIPVVSYPEMLGHLSGLFDSSGISGTHGKTTTTAMAGTILKVLQLPVTVIAGSEVPTFGNRSTVTAGKKYLIAETCEYRRHFHLFKADRIVICSVDEDHLDYYSDIEDIYDAFEQYGRNLPYMGTVIYNADDAGALAVAERIRRRRDDLNFIPFGKNAMGRYRLLSVELREGVQHFSLEGAGDFELKVPGMHSVLNACGAIALAENIAEAEGLDLSESLAERMRRALFDFRGSRRRSEVLGEARGILFIDDYAHHPTEIKATLKGMQEFYPGRRVIADFMPHTYSRTEALIDSFAESFESADIVILHGIYASAREKDNRGITGKDLFNRVKENHAGVFYFEDYMEAVPFLEKNLKKGDLFLTMGAGDNWKLGKMVFNHFLKAT